MAMMIVAAFAAAVRAEVAQAAAPISEKAAVHAAASDVAVTLEKDNVGANDISSSVRYAAPVERGGYGGYPYPKYPRYPPPTLLPTLDVREGQTRGQ
jgi:hypothetical protein